MVTLACAAGSRVCTNHCRGVCATSIGAFAAALMAPVISYYQAMSAPGTDPWTAKQVEARRGVPIVDLVKGWTERAPILEEFVSSIPGGVDPHIHCGLEWKVSGQPAIYTDPAAQVSRAALHGGTTTLIDFVQCTHDRTIQQSIEHWQGTWKDACHCDYGFHLMLVGAMPTAHFGQLADAMQDGHASVKIFTTDIIPGMGSQLMMPHGHIWEALKVVAAQGGISDKPNSAQPAGAVQVRDLITIAECRNSARGRHRIARGELVIDGMYRVGLLPGLRLIDVIGVHW